MKIAIHNTKGSFSDRWIAYCIKNNIPYKLVNCYDFDIITQLNNCSGLMWHWNQNDYKGILFARQLIFSLEKLGVKVFPDINTSWHFDDKVGQKYLLEAIGAPLVQSYIFYSKQDALNWIATTSFPKVFKLRGGAGSVNVQLVKNKQKAIKLAKKAFSGGFSHINKYTRLKDRFSDFKRDRNLRTFKKVAGGFARLFFLTEIEKFSSNDKGYIYFQDFIPNNNYDTRIIVIGNRCVGVRRYCRNGDFRASGSGVKGYDKKFFSKDLVQESFNIAEKLQSQSLALDFIYDEGEHKVVEISYCYIIGSFYDDCHGYWDRDLIWHDKEVNLQNFIIEDFIKINK